VQAFARHSRGTRASPDTIAKALAALRAHAGLAAHPRFDQWVAGNDAALTSSEVNGFNLHRQGPLQQLPHRLCLHRPRLYDIGLRTRIRAATSSGLPVANHAFKVPTLRELAGPRPTCTTLARHPRRRRARLQMGGVARPTRQGPARHHRLTDQERADLVAFLEACRQTPPQPSTDLGQRPEPTRPLQPRDTTLVSQKDKLFAPQKSP
jgi:hypothetical protein